VSAPGRQRPIKPRWGRIAGAALLTVAALALIVAFGPWGGDDDAGATTGTEETWSAKANAYCADGIQETSALTLPSSARQVAADAEARIQIVATVRDGIYTLGEPPDLDPTLSTVYLDGLTKDLDSLDEIRKAARSGGDYQSLNAGFQETSGGTAAKLGLDDCAAFAQSIARTP